MAKPMMIETGLGTVPAPIKLLRNDDGLVTEESLVQMNAYLQLLAQKVNKLSLGDLTAYSHAGNLDAQRIPLKTPSVADTEMEIDHSLRRIPSGYIVVLQDKAGSLYTSSYGSWSQNTIYLKFSAASALVDIILF